MALSDRWADGDETVGPELPPGNYQTVVVNAVVNEGDKPKIITTLLVVGGEENWIGTIHDFWDNMSTDKNIGFMKRKFRNCGIEDVSILPKCLATYKYRKIAIVVTESGGFVNFRVERLLKVLSKDDVSDLLAKYKVKQKDKPQAKAPANDNDDDDGGDDGTKDVPAKPVEKPAAKPTPATESSRKLPEQHEISSMAADEVEALLASLECDPKKCRSAPLEVAKFLVAVVEGDAFDPGAGVVKLTAKALGLKFDKNADDSDVEKLIEATL